MRSSSRLKRAALPRSAPATSAGGSKTDGNHGLIAGTAAKRRTKKEADDAQGPSKPAPKKRRKVIPVKEPEPAASGSEASTQTSHADTKQPEQHLPSLPLDVLYEIFSVLDPHGLIQLTHTCKYLCTVLASRKLDWAWKVARKNSPGLETWDPPKDMSEMRWASLVADTSCSNCGAGGVTSVDFRLRMHLCEQCSKDGLIHSSRLAKAYPDLLPIVRELVPYTNKKLHSNKKSDKYFWIDDLQSMDKKIRKLQAEDPSAVDDFCKERRDLVKSILGRASYLRQWHARYMESRVDFRMDQIAGRFQAIGYQFEDLDNPKFYLHPLVRLDTPLTDAEFAEMREVLQPVLAQIKQQRTKAERSSKVLELYDQYKKTLLPIQRIYVPDDGNFLWKYPKFSALLTRDTSLEITDAEWAEATDALPTYLSRFIEAKRDKHIALMHDRYPAPDAMEFITLAASPQALQHAREETMPHFAGPLELAIATFTHREDTVVRYNRLFTGRELCNSWFEKVKFQFADRESGLVAQMVRMAGLNPRSTTATEMDDLGAQFFCRTCHNTDHERAKAAQEPHTLWACSWRGLLDHFRGSHPTAIKIGLVNHEFYTLERTHNVIDIFENWCCNHCSEEAVAFLPRQAADDHLQAAHGVLTPSVGRDVFFRPPALNVMAPHGIQSYYQFKDSIPPQASLSTKEPSPTS
ncbi:hypothetical protein DENSPDRAFT_876965 [Dentipellis sp. KUC8613]|nr:hypothetical protein DENSPDRAFT_876965 [Dentipellis sp. KUC8613]